MTEILTTAGDPTELFADREGRVEIPYDELDVETLATIRDYVKARPRLEARFVKRRSALLGDSLIIEWRWRR